MALHHFTPTLNLKRIFLVPLYEFTYCRGKLDNNAPPLNSAPVRKFGLQVAGGVYEEDKQSGAGAMEILWIKLVP